MIGTETDLPFDDDNERIIQPSYLNQDIGEDDDDDDDDDDDIDPEDDFEIYKEAETEKILEKKEDIYMTNGQQTPFTNSGPFTQQQTQTAWTPPNTTWQRPGWGNQTQQQTTTQWQSPFIQQTQHQQTTWNSSGIGSNQRKELPRGTKVVMCDVLDGLMEPIQANGRPGLVPRGIYDSRIKFEVWDKLGCLGVEFVYGYSDVQTYSDDWSALCNYILRGLSQYLRLPAENCRSMIQMSYHQSKLGVVKSVLETLNITTGYQKEDVLMVGCGSGFANQNNRDSKIAEQLGIAYIDLGQFLSLYI